MDLGQKRNGGKIKKERKGQQARDGGNMALQIAWMQNVQCSVWEERLYVRFEQCSFDLRVASLLFSVPLLLNAGFS